MQATELAASGLRTSDSSWLDPNHDVINGYISLPQPGFIRFSQNKKTKHKLGFCTSKGLKFL